MNIFLPEKDIRYIWLSILLSDQVADEYHRILDRITQDQQSDILYIFLWEAGYVTSKLILPFKSHVRFLLDRNITRRQRRITTCRRRVFEIDERSVEIPATGGSLRQRCIRFVGDRHASRCSSRTRYFASDTRNTTSYWPVIGRVLSPSRSTFRPILARS